MFTLGVSSGEPRPDGVVLWTRLAPEPLAGGGMLPVPVPVRFEVAPDDAFRSIVQVGVRMGGAPPRSQRHMAAEDLDLVVHLGDYIYEHAGNVYQSPSGNVRLHAGAETVTLDGYRSRPAIGFWPSWRSIRSEIRWC